MYCALFAQLVVHSTTPIFLGSGGIAGVWYHHFERLYPMGGIGDFDWVHRVHSKSTQVYSLVYCRYTGGVQVVYRSTAYSDRNSKI